MNHVSLIVRLRPEEADALRASAGRSASGDPVSLSAEVRKIVREHFRGTDGAGRLAEGKTETWGTSSAVRQKN
jgi:hypothetical protein